MSNFEYLQNVVTLQLDQAACIGCGMCIEVCPRSVLSIPAGIARIERRDRCIECGACMRNCPVGAVAVRSGVGCAAAVINSLLGRKGGCCCTIDESSSDKGCFC
ncbi:MAG: 4Fe-4S binding protein [Deltaproteobacteria bacterium]|nr:4Fe-4S binding protein [Deltaproteobacteria bacterium]